jgi:hypothetical protein
MSRRDRHGSRPHLEFLEGRLQPSVALTPGVLGLAEGLVSRPGMIAATTATVAPQNLTPDKHATLFGIFVQPAASSPLDPRIVAVEGSHGQRLPIFSGRPFRPADGGQASDQAVAFVKASSPGTLMILVTGKNHTTGSYTVETTLPGDVNGDGQVNLADLNLFAKAYSSERGQTAYSPAADFNRNGLVNLYDAKMLEHNMTPRTPEIPLNAAINLLPSDQAHYAAPKNSGGSTSKKDITINGYTTPGSLVIQDGKAKDYSFSGSAVATDARGFFSFPEKNKEGLNNNDFLILDPFGHQLIRDLPVFWIPFAAPGSKLK